MATFISKTWSWSNPHSGDPSHYMRVRFNASATYDATNVYVVLTDIQVDGWNGIDPDPGTTQDHIVIAKNGTNLPATAPSPARPIALPFPSDLASRGGIAEMATYLNSGNPQRYFWSVSSSESYTVPYAGPNTKVVYGWNSHFEGDDIDWGVDGWSVELEELDYRPGQHRVSGVWQSHNRSAGDANKRQGGAWVEMRTTTGSGDPPLIRRGGAWVNQAKIGANAS